MTALLTEHRDKLESLVDGLLRDETLDQDAAYAAAQVDPHAVPHTVGRADGRATSRSATARPR